MYQFQRTVPAFVNDNLNYPKTFKDNLIANNIEDGPITLYGWNLYNPNSVDVFFKFFNSGIEPILGTAIPVLTIQIPATGSVVFFGSDQYMYFSLKMWVHVTTGYLDDSTEEPPLGVIAQIQYK